MNTSKYNNPTPPWIETLSFDSYKDTSEEKYKDIYPTTIMDTVKYFKTYPSGPTMTFAEFKAKPVFPATVHLVQSDFTNGTVRLRHSAHYVLKENIIFEPNASTNWMPTTTQTDHGANADYPIGRHGGYHLGFFAAITIEAAHVFLDLNGKTLRQSVMFSVQQRFYANIELASSPFIPLQGPGSFGDTIVAASKTLIANGNLGLSSHHGIHGNGMSEIIIQNLTIHEFEVAGIALNGGTNCLVRNVQICNMSNDITVLSTYSSARFMQPTLEAIVKNNNKAMLGNKKGTDILGRLNAAMKEVFTATRNGTAISDSSIFKNKTGIYDGGGYGIVLNSRGVAVHGFKKNRDGAIGNENNVIHDVVIDNLMVGNGEIVGVSLNAPESTGGAYGGKQQVGIAGDVLQIKVVSNEEGAYVGNVLSDAKLFVAHHVGGSQQGTTNITPLIIDWAIHGHSNLDALLIAKGLYFVSGGDSMGHVMKGVIGLFISAGLNIQAFNMKIKNLSNKNTSGTANRPEKDDKADGKADGKADIVPLEVEFNGAAVRGVAVSGSTAVNLRNIIVEGLSSTSGVACGVDFLHTNIGIVSRDNISMDNIRSVSTRNTGKAPNPQDSRPIFFGVSKDTTGLIK
jgi:hypothetical protein